jgi:hypothetical protein
MVVGSAVGAIRAVGKTRQVKPPAQWQILALSSRADAQFLGSFRKSQPTPRHDGAVSTADRSDREFPGGPQ